MTDRLVMLVLKAEVFCAIGKTVGMTAMYVAQGGVLHGRDSGQSSPMKVTVVSVAHAARKRIALHDSIDPDVPGNYSIRELGKIVGRTLLADLKACSYSWKMSNISSSLA